MAGIDTPHTSRAFRVLRAGAESVGERNTHGGYRCGDLRSGNRPRERSSTSGWREVALLDIEGGDMAAGVIPCWRIVDRKCRSLCERVSY
jgi:hypothetical protein